MSPDREPRNNRTRHALRIAYVGDFIGHGTNLPQLGTALAVLAARDSRVELVKVICPVRTGPDEEPKALPARIRFSPLYDLEQPLTLLRVIDSIRRDRFDLVIFSLYPTSFGRGNLVNFIGMLNPILVSMFTRTPVSTIYHNSVRTNDYRRLGYSRRGDRLRAQLIRGIETALSHWTRLFLTLGTYETEVRRTMARGKIDRIDIEFMDGIAGAFMRSLLDLENIRSLPYRRSPLPTILLHGWWGPQKDARFALEILRRVKLTGKAFHAVMSGSVSHKFPGYQAEFDALRLEYSDVIDEYLGFVPEANLSDLLIGCDILLLPYIVPGGISGVLESASFYGLTIIAPDFAEFREQAITKTNVVVARPEDFERVLLEKIDHFQDADRTIDVRAKLAIAQTNFGEFIDRSLGTTSEVDGRKSKTRR